MASARIEELLPGQTVRASTVLGETVDGLVLNYDQTTQCLLLQDLAASMGTSSAVAGGSGSGPSRSVTFLRRAAIKQLLVTNKEITERLAGRQVLDPPHVDMQALRAREAAALKKAEEEAELISRGVTREALDLYSALSKTLPVSWEGTSIVVLGEIMVRSPYQPDSVTGGRAEAKERVKVVLARERERLGLREQA